MIQFILLLTLTLAQENPIQFTKITPLLVENIDQFIKVHPHVLIEFYAPWCAPCQQFVPEYKSLNEKVQTEGLDVQIASYDATKDLNRIALTKFKISSFPSFLLFIESRPFVYDGARSSDGMLSWIKQLLLAPKPTEVLTETQFNDFLQQNDLVLLYQGVIDNHNDPNYWTFYELSKTSSADTSFVFSQLTKIGNPGGLYLYSKQSDQRKTFTQAFTKQNIQRFILINQLPDVPKLDDQSTKLVYSGVTTSFILFTGVGDISQKAEKAFHETAQLFKKTYQFAYSKVSDDKFFEELGNLGADDGVLPKIVAWHMGNKYKYNGPDFSVKGIKSFIFDFRQGKIDRYVKSEPIPTKEENSYVKKIVGQNFDEEILKSGKNVLLEYYADWCGACKQFKSTYELIAYELRDYPNLMVAKINAPDNELQDSYQPHSYPDIVFFKAGDKKPIHFANEERNLTTVLDFVRDNIKLTQQQ